VQGIRQRAVNKQTDWLFGAMSSAPIHRISSNNAAEWRLCFPPRLLSSHALTAKCRGASLTEHHHKLLNLQQWASPIAASHAGDKPPRAPLPLLGSIEIRPFIDPGSYDPSTVNIGRIVGEIGMSLLFRRNGCGLEIFLSLSLSLFDVFHRYFVDEDIEKAVYV